MSDSKNIDSLIPTNNSRKLTFKFGWHQLYFMLAFIDVLTICAALLLSQSLMNIYQKSVEQNQQMSLSSHEFIKLGYIAKEANEPGNRVFNSGDIKYERDILEQSVVWFDTAFHHAIDKFKQAFSQQQFQFIQADTEKLQRNMALMVQEAKLVFSALEANDINEAGIHMSKMDGYFYVVSESLGDITQYISDQQNEQFKQQIKYAKNLKSYEYIISLVVVLIISLVTIYGHKLGKKLKQNSLRLEKALADAEQSAQVKATFLANMSHEIRTPMNGVFNMLKLIDTDHLTVKDKEYLQIALSSTNHLMVIINDILDISQLKQHKFKFEQQSCNFNTLIQQQVSLFTSSAQEKNLTIEFSDQSNLKSNVLADPTRVSQVISNLINNAIKFTEQGQISVRVYQTDNSDNLDIVNLSVEIKDTGIGIETEPLKNIFNSFEQADASTKRRFGGTGLGLAISKNLCERMGGEIKVVSTPGVGSIFTALFKFKVDTTNVITSPSKIDSTAQSELAPLGLHLLIAEDNKVNQMVFSALIKKLGCTFELAENGLEAIELLKLHQFDGVLMDCLMPEMDGFEATEQIRLGNAGENNKTIPIIAVSANSMASDIEKCKSVGMNEHIAKPIDSTKLHTTLQKICGNNHG